MMEKRGQVSLFLILTVVIVIGITIYLFVAINAEDTKDFVPSVLSFNEDAQTIEQYIQSCLEDASVEAIGVIMLDGGQSRLKAYRDAPTTEFPYGKADPLYYIVGQRHVPLTYLYNEEIGPIDLTYTTDQLEMQVADKVNLSMPYCLKGFQHFIDQGYTIRTKGSQTSVAFVSENNIKIKYKLDLDVMSENRQRRVKEVYTHKVKSNLHFYNKILRLLLAYYTEKDANPNAIPEFYLNALAYKYDFFYNRLQLSDDRIMITLIKNATMTEDTVSAFNVILQYDWDSYRFLDPRINPTAIPITGSAVFDLEEKHQPYTGLHHSDFTWDLATFFAGYDLFTIYSDQFNINDAGLVTIKPQYPHMGDHEFIVRAGKSADSKDIEYKKFSVNIQDTVHDIPSTFVVKDLDVYHGFDLYHRFWAVGTQDRVPFFSAEFPSELQNMRCGGYIYLDLRTGELFGHITAPPGDYTIPITIFQTMDDGSSHYVTYDTTLHVLGNYNYDCR